MIARTHTRTLLRRSVGFAHAPGFGNLFRIKCNFATDVRSARAAKGAVYCGDTAIGLEAMNASVSMGVGLVRRRLQRAALAQCGGRAGHVGGQAPMLHALLPAARRGAGCGLLGAAPMHTVALSHDQGKGDTLDAAGSTLGPEGGEVAGSGRASVQTIRALHGAGDAAVGARAVVRGWVRSCRAQKKVSFVELGDGSCLHGLQIIVDDGVEARAGVAAGVPHGDVDPRRLAVGASVEVSGNVVASPPGKGGKAKPAHQALELHADRVTLIGGCDGASYPLQKKVRRQWQ